MAVTRVCIYTRISTDEENQPTSLHSQRERLEAFCKAQEGWRIVARHEDRATGTKLERPGLQAALDLARDGRIDLLLVYRVDRLSRKVRQLAQLAEALDTYQVVLRSATEPADPGATRRRTSANPAHLQARHARGLRNVRKSGACRDRTGHAVGNRGPGRHRERSNTATKAEQTASPSAERSSGRCQASARRL
jgi:site-specific DNA recombinase